METNEARLIARYAPVLVLHLKEKYFPTSVARYLEASEVVVGKEERGAKKKRKGRNQSDLHDVLVQKGEVTVDAAVETCRSVRGRTVMLHVGEGDRGGVHPDEGLENVPIYAALKMVEVDGEVVAIEINYMFFYAFNGAYRVLGFRFGEHMGDWEHVTVRLFPDGEMQGVYYNSHKNYHGDWLPAGKVPLYENERPLVYVAKHGHACYSRPGTHARIFLLANDVCSKNGIVWKPNEVRRLHPKAKVVRCRGGVLQSTAKAPLLDIRPRCMPDVELKERNEVVVADDNSGWTDFDGRWGTVVAPTNQNWFVYAEHPRSWGGFRRAFCACLPNPEVEFR